MTLSAEMGGSGKASGAIMPSMAITMPPLMKSWMAAFELWGRPWYLAAARLRALKIMPPMNIQGIQVGICYVDLSGVFYPGSDAAGGGA